MRYYLQILNEPSLGTINSIFFFFSGVVGVAKSRRFDEKKNGAVGFTVDKNQSKLSLN